MQLPKRPGKSSPLTSWFCFIYLLLAGKMRKYFSAGKSRSAPAYKAYIPQNHNFQNVEGNDTMGKSHPLLTGDGMRSASTALRIVLNTTPVRFPDCYRTWMGVVVLILLRFHLFFHETASFGVHLGLVVVVFAVICGTDAELPFCSIAFVVLHAGHSVGLLFPQLFTVGRPTHHNLAMHPFTLVS